LVKNTIENDKEKHLYKIATGELSLPDDSMACNQSLEVLVWDVNRRHHRILHEEIN
jgi:hypothetical protein